MALTDSSQSRILILGAGGQLGSELVSALHGKAQLTAVTRHSTPGFDLSEPDTLEEKIREVRPDIVINSAAYTAVDKAESEPELARIINAEAPAVIAGTCAALGAPLIHYSTDYVFDGCKTSPYTEDDVTGPVSAYGQTKLQGELAIQASGCQHYIFRTSWVYAAHGQNFMQTMLRLAHERDALSIVSDQYGSPTWTGFLARETARLVSLLTDSSNAPESGIYHLTCSGTTTWHDFAAAIFEAAKAKGIIENIPALTAITTDQYPTPAKRPEYSALNIEKVQQHLGIIPMTWQDGLEACMQQFIQIHKNDESA